jgi:hypothetical protein
MLPFSNVVMDDFKNISVIGLFIYVLHSTQWTRILAWVSFLAYVGIYVCQKHFIAPTLHFPWIKSPEGLEPIVFEDTTPITRSRKKRRGSE